MTRQTKIILWIIALTAYDYFCTFIGVTCNFVTEINPLASALFNWSWVGGWAVIIASQTLFIGLIAANIHKYAWLYRACIFLSGFKSAVAIMHLYWIIAIFRQ